MLYFAISFIRDAMIDQEAVYFALAAELMALIVWNPCLILYDLTWAALYCPNAPYFYLHRLFSGHTFCQAKSF